MFAKEIRKITWSSALALLALALAVQPILAASPVVWRNHTVLAGLLFMCLAYAALLIALFHRGFSRVVVRLMHRVPLGGLGAASNAVAGQSRHYFAFFRTDFASTCFTGQNSSNGVSVTWTP